jgi:hypothetical protein
MWLSWTIDDNMAFEAISQHHIIPASFDYTIGNTSSHIHNLWWRLSYFFLALCRTNLA